MGKNCKFRCNNCNHLFFASNETEFCPNCNKATLTKLTFYEILRNLGLNPDKNDKSLQE